ncbi:hypothetical protein BGZ90_006876 [Linnemannia elongata]|nr:hypothetical protein BGZ90_006876 [Linnemannia elongata]
MTYITDLPAEILEHIGLALTTSTSIVPLILVSRWAHHQFQHLVWRRITITAATSTAFIPTVKDHAHLVFSLRFQDAVPKEFYRIAFPRLVTFQLYNSDYYVKARGMCFNLADLFRLNPSIQDIIINAKHLPLNRYFWNAIRTSLHNLRRLYFAGSGDVGSTMFHRSNISGHLICDIWRRLEEIEHAGGDRPWFNAAVEEDLSLEEFGWNDDETARLFFSHLGPLKHLRMTRGNLGPRSFDLLRERHFDSLRTFCVENYRNVTSEMMLGVLQNCSQLEVFEARRMPLLDLRANPGPWTCLGLRRFRVILETDPADPEVDRMFFEQLSRLTNLEVFDISWPFLKGVAWEDPQQPAPLLRLDRGLGQLSTLIQLRTVNVESTGQELSIEDVEWMLEHWPLLTRLSGQLSSDTDIEERLSGLLVDRRVVCDQFTHSTEILYEYLSGLFSDSS